MIKLNFSSLSNMSNQFSPFLCLRVVGGNHVISIVIYYYYYYYYNYFKHLNKTLYKQTMDTLIRRRHFVVSDLGLNCLYIARKNGRF